MFYCEVQMFGRWRPRTMETRPKTKSISGIERLLTSEGASWPIRDVITVPPEWQGLLLDDLEALKEPMRVRERKAARQLKLPAA